MDEVTGRRTENTGSRDENWINEYLHSFILSRFLSFFLPFLSFLLVMSGERAARVGRRGVRRFDEKGGLGGEQSETVIELATSGRRQLGGTG